MSGPASTGGDPSPPTSAIVAHTANRSRDLRIGGYEAIKGIPTGSALRTDSFRVGGRNWHVCFFPNGTAAETAEYISVFLVREDGHPGPAMANFELSLVDRGGVPVRAYTKSTRYRPFPGPGASSGFPFFVKRSFLERSKHLRNDDFLLRYDVSVVIQYRSEDPADSSPRMPPLGFPQDFGDLLLSGEGFDVTFLVEGETFMAHRCVLRARSPVFRAAFRSQMLEGDPANTVVIEEIRADVFKNMLSFVYAGHLPAMEPEEQVPMLQHLLVAADWYDINSLKQVSQVTLSKKLDVGNATTTLALAEQHQCVTLKEGCFKFIGSPGIFSAVIKTEDFMYLASNFPSIMIELMSRCGPR